MYKQEDVNKALASTIQHFNSWLQGKKPKLLILSDGELKGVFLNHLKASLREVLPKTYMQVRPLYSAIKVKDLEHISLNQNETALGSIEFTERLSLYNDKVTLMQQLRVACDCISVRSAIAEGIKKTEATVTKTVVEQQDNTIPKLLAEMQEMISNIKFNFKNE